MKTTDVFFTSCCWCCLVFFLNIFLLIFEVFYLGQCYYKALLRTTWAVKEKCHKGGYFNKCLNQQVSHLLVLFAQLNSLLSGRFFFTGNIVLSKASWKKTKQSKQTNKQTNTSGGLRHRLAIEQHLSTQS